MWHSLSIFFGESSRFSEKVRKNTMFLHNIFSTLYTNCVTCFVKILSVLGDFWVRMSILKKVDIFIVRFFMLEWFFQKIHIVSCSVLSGFVFIFSHTIVVLTAKKCICQTGEYFWVVGGISAVSQGMISSGVELLWVIYLWNENFVNLSGILR